MGNDFLGLEAMRRRNTSATFRAHAGRGHDFFGFKNSQIDREDFYRDRMSNDFLRWAGLLPRK